MSTPNPLQTVVNAQAIKIAEAQYRLANLFTPYNFNPERVDFDRGEAFLADPYSAFPQPTDGIRRSLDTIIESIAEAKAILDALSSQCQPDLDPEQLYVTAKANVVGNRANTAAYRAA